MRNSVCYFIVCCVAALSISCEKTIKIDIPGAGENLVVEGFIENGSFPYFTLTRSLSIFDPGFTIEPEKYFINTATATISDDLGNSYPMNLLCLSDLDSATRAAVAKQFGADSSLASSLCIYTNILVQGEIGRTYTLEIQTQEGNQLKATTSIRELVQIDSVWSMPEPSNPDSLRVLFARFKDPDQLGNYYRYFTATNTEPFYPGLFASVTDDNVFNGQVVPAPFDRGYPRNAEIDFATYGKFTVGDTVSIKLSQLDQAHFDFWRTAEDPGSSGGGLFSTPIKVLSNVEGGLGIFGGYSSSVATLVMN